MRLLIDECLHYTLVKVAEGFGHEATHIAWLGLSGRPDRDVLKRTIETDSTLVTNDATDFLKLYRREELHAGLILLIPQVPPDLQRMLFDEALATIAGDELVNEIVEAELRGDEIAIRRYPLP